MEDKKQSTFGIFNFYVSVQIMISAFCPHLVQKHLFFPHSSEEKNDIKVKNAVTESVIFCFVIVIQFQYPVFGK